MAGREAVRGARRGLAGTGPTWDPRAGPGGRGCSRAGAELGPWESPCPPASSDEGLWPSSLATHGERVRGSVCMCSLCVPNVVWSFTRPRGPYMSTHLGTPPQPCPAHTPRPPTRPPGSWMGAIGQGAECGPKSEGCHRGRPRDTSGSNNPNNNTTTTGPPKCPRCAGLCQAHPRRLYTKFSRPLQMRPQATFRFSAQSPL